MATLARARVSWNGVGVVGGGISTFYSTDVSMAWITPLRAFFAGAASALPPSVDITMPVSGDLIDSADGALAGSWTTAPSANIVGTGPAPFAGGVGGRVQWTTGGVTRGRRVKGSTFLVPFSNTMYDANGTLDNGLVSSYATACATLITATGGDLVVWSRPSSPGASDGAAHAILSGRLVDKVSWLRTRRT